MFSQLKRKLVAVNMVVLVLLILSLFSSIYFLMDKNGKDALQRNLSDISNSIRPSPTGEIRARGPNQDKIIFILANNPKRPTPSLYSTQLDIDEETINELFRQTIRLRPSTGSVTIDDSTFLYEKKDSPAGLELVFLDTRQHQQMMNRLLITLLVVGLFSILLLLMMSLYFAHNAVKPIETAFDQQKQFIADASHELKTPLAVIQTNLDVICSNEQQLVQQQKKWINHIQFQLNHISGLIANMLYLARLEGQDLPSTLAPVDLSATVNNQLISFEAMAFEHNLAIESNIEDQIIINGIQEEFAQLVAILVDNGIKHSHPHTHLTIALTKTKHRILLQVANIGEPIPIEYQDKIFQRFYQVEQSRSPEQPGYGLGLAIAKSIVEHHHGTIGVSSTNRQTTFTVELPAKLTSFSS